MRRVLLPEFQNVTAGGTAVIPNIPMGPTYHGFLLKLGGTTFTKSLIELIRIRLGGKPIWEITGDQLDTINKFMGMQEDAAYLLIPFSDFNARTILGESIGAIDTSLNYSGFSMEVKIGGGAAAPELSGWSMITPAKLAASALERAMFRAMLTVTENIGNAGTFDLRPAMGGLTPNIQRLKRVHFFHSTIDEISVRLDASDLLDQVSPADEQFWQNNLTRVAQAGHFAFDPLTLDNQSDAIPVSANIAGSLRHRNWQFRTTTSGAGNIIMLSELYGTIDAV